MFNIDRGRALNKYCELEKSRKSKFSLTFELVLDTFDPHKQKLQNSQIFWKITM